MAEQKITEAPESRAESFGIHTADSEIIFGAAEPREAPLSGEWADDLSPRDLFILVMQRDAVTEEDYLLIEDLAVSFEAGYFSRWGEVDDA